MQPACRSAPMAAADTADALPAPLLFCSLLLCLLLVLQGTVTGKPYAIIFCLIGTVCNGAMMTFSGKVGAALCLLAESPTRRCSSGNTVRRQAL